MTNVGGQGGRVLMPESCVSTPVAAESPGILQRLRSVTRAAHASIERVPSLSRLLAPDLTVADYVQTLRRLHAFFGCIEPFLAYDLRGESRADALLDGAGIADLAADIAWFGALPMETPPPFRPPTGVAAALGTLYVIEGSKLGARIIGRQLAKSLGVGGGAGGSFYCGLTAETGRRRWHSLQEVLRVEIDEPGVACEPVTSAALATFAALEAWMADEGACATGGHTSVVRA